jgi:hypothetical protein
VRVLIRGSDQGGGITLVQTSQHTKACPSNSRGQAFVAHRACANDSVNSTMAKDEPSPSIRQFDAYSRYETGLRQLRNRVEQDHPRYSDFLVCQQRLTDNIAKSRQQLGGTRLTHGQVETEDIRLFPCHRRGKDVLSDPQLHLHCPKEWTAGIGGSANGTDWLTLLPTCASTTSLPRRLSSYHERKDDQCLRQSRRM